jgi:threonylcarbamoyladenosine tRNA methylthiotransferase MtaB
MRAAIKTLGCKLNQYESEQIREQLEQRGYRIVPFEGEADVYIVNSCTVTSRTDRDCRRLARHAKGLNPAATVIVTGCYAQVAAERLSEIEAVDHVVGNTEKARLVERLPAAGPITETPSEGMIEQFAGHTRAFVKVQEGCDAHCTYCIVPLARGASRSTPVEEVLAQAERLIASGHPELVLIGIHLGKYGGDLPGGPDLAALCERLCELSGLGRLRLSSIEPCEVSPRLIELVAAGGHALTPRPGIPGGGRLCRHFHIPLQSGSDGVLRRMNRPYDAAFYSHLVQTIRQADPRIGIGADVMVGFPGETEQEFEETRALLDALPLTYLHVFSYSPRPGTPAAEMPEQIQGYVKQERSRVLRELSEGKRRTFAEAQIGERLEVVVERFARESDTLLRGVSDNYVQVVLAGGDELMGGIVAVEALRHEAGRLVCRPAE